MAYHGEICQDCGTPAVQGTGINSFWHAPNELWNDVVNNNQPGELGTGVLCMRCFSDRCKAKGIHIAWEAYVYAQDDEL